MGSYSPPFGFQKDKNEMVKIVHMLRESKADMLFVGMGSPKQDIFIYENIARLPNSNIIFNGGCFRFYCW